MEPKLSKERIIHAAFDLLAEKQTIAGLSMRTLAVKLDIKAPALYWYFKNKQSLLQAMAEVMEDHLVLPDSSLPWNQQIAAFMANYYDLYTEFPCGAELEIHTIPAFPSRLLHLQQMMTLLKEAGFSIKQSHNTINALHHQLIGQLMDQQQEALLKQEVLRGQKDMQEYVQFMHHFTKEHQLRDMASVLANRQKENPKQDFLTGVAIYLDGLTKFLENKHKEKSE
ncbi:TetR family transcriptional regulator [Enterococcus massiliensis]|uniref:TetR family transcriptional regulator n=1 Tax=Enterococcus massiliensis TaxID=1640685 RepID=UPI00065E0548|nr:TetR family transcriptional regulator [Enterococcus massiliensis]